MAQNQVAQVQVLVVKTGIFTHILKKKFLKFLGSLVGLPATKIK